MLSATMASNRYTPWTNLVYGAMLKHSTIVARWAASASP
jgi:hypothetical protein